jgi:hypothetical protein
VNDVIGWSEFVQKEPQLAETLQHFTTLEHLLAWFPSVGVDLSKLDLIAQDEYSHDLIVPLTNRSKWYVFGMT